MADLSRKTVSIYIDSSIAEQALVKLQSTADKLTASIATGTAAGKTMVSELSKLDKVNTQIASVKQQIDQGLAPSFNQLQAAAAKANAELRKMSSDDPGYAQKVGQVKDLKKSLADLTAQTYSVRDSATELTDGFEKIFIRVGDYISAFAVIDGLKSLFTGAIAEADKAELATVNLKNALDNVGRSDLFDKFTESVKNLSAQFKALDPNDISAVFTKLIAYGKLTQTQIEQLTTVIINYAARQKVSLSEATDVMTNAMEGNARGLKLYGINIKEATTVTERLGLILNDLGPKVAGSEAAFESTNKGALASFIENITKAKEKLGDLIYSLISTKESSSEVFDEAKQKTDNYKASLDPLLERYDQLKSKTSLNKDEQTELEGIIQKIVAILPSAATEIDKYGVALDINKAKVTDFLNENKKFLAEKNFQAVEDITAKLLLNLQQINKQTKELNSGQITVVSGGGGVGAPGLPYQKTASVEESKQQLSDLRILQEQLITDASTLTDKYGKTLPKSVQDAVNAIKGEFAAISKATKPDTTIIGTGDPNADPKADKEAEKQMQESLKRAAAFHQQALAALAAASQTELEILKNKYAIEGDNQALSLAERLTAVTAYYNASLKQIQANKDAQEVALNNEIANDKKNSKSKEETAQINQLQVAKQSEIEEKYALAVSQVQIQVAQKYTTITAEEFKKQQALIDQRYKYAADAEAQSAKDKTNQVEISNDAKLLALDKAFLDGKIKNEKYYQDQRQILIDQGNANVEAAKLKSLQTIQGFLKIYGIDDTNIDQQIADLEVQIEQNATNKKIKIKKTAEEQRAIVEKGIITGAQTVATVLGDIDDIKNASDQAAIEANNTLLTNQTTLIDQELAKHVISQTEHDRQIAALQAKTTAANNALALKEFKRNQALQLAQAIINGANAVIVGLNAVPPPLNFIEAAAAGVAAAAQIAVIASQKPPTMGKGGLLDGPFHSEGGMPVINPRTGRKVAEVEGGEPILSRKTYANNRELVNQLLHASMYGNGMRITPYSQQRGEYRPFNYSGIAQSMHRVKQFDNGGILPNGSSVSSTQNNDILNQNLSSIKNSIDTSNIVNSRLADRLGNPFKSYVLLSDFNTTQALNNKIIQDTTIRRK